MPCMPKSDPCNLHVYCYVHVSGTIILMQFKRNNKASSLPTRGLGMTTKISIRRLTHQQSAWEFFRRTWLDHPLSSIGLWISADICLLTPAGNLIRQNLLICAADRPIEESRLCSCAHTKWSRHRPVISLLSMDQLRDFLLTRSIPLGWISPMSERL